MLWRERLVGGDPFRITYQWDDFNKLIAVGSTLDGAPTADVKQESLYSPNGFRRRKKDKNGTFTTEYADGLATAVAKSTSTVTYLMGHQLMGFERDGDFFYFLTDHLGSVRDIVSGTDGSVLQSYDYRENGEKTTSTSFHLANGFRRKKKAKSGAVTTEYSAGLSTAMAQVGSEPISYIQGHHILGFEKGGSFYWYLTDHLGSVRDIVSGTDGSVLQSYDYRENGEKTASTSFQSDKTWVGGLSVNDDTADSGLYLMGHRHYDATLGRFLSQDPIGFAGGLNLYEYSSNSPVGMVDPEGLRPPYSRMEHILGKEMPDLPLGQADVDFFTATIGIVSMIAAAPEAAFVGGATASYYGLHQVGGRLTLWGLEQQGLGAGLAVAGGAAASRATQQQPCQVDPRSLVSRQPRSQMTGNKVKRYRKAMRAQGGYGNFPPIEVARVDGKNIIWDGHHRTQAAIGEGIRQVPVQYRAVSAQETSQLIRDVIEAIEGF